MCEFDACWMLCCGNSAWVCGNVSGLSGVVENNGFHEPGCGEVFCMSM